LGSNASNQESKKADYASFFHLAHNDGKDGTTQLAYFG